MTDHPPVGIVVDTPLTRLIGARMKELGISRKKLSLAAGLGPTYIRDLLEGRSRSPEAAKLAAIATVLQMPTTALLGAAQAQGGEVVVDAEERLLLSTWRELSEEMQADVMEYIAFRLARLRSGDRS